MVKTRHEIITTAEKVAASWSNLEKARFHGWNPNGLAQRKFKNDERISELVIQGKAKSGAILAYGGFNDFTINTLLELVLAKRVTRIQLEVALEMLERDCERAEQVIAECEAADPLEVNKYANLHGYTDVTPFEIVRVISDKTIEIRKMAYDLAQDEKPEMIAGGFAGHCVNQHELKYEISSNPANPVIRAHRRADGYFHSIYGRHMLNDKPIRFYDYNF